VREIAGACALAALLAAASMEGAAQPARVPPGQRPADVPALLRFVAGIFPPKLLNDAWLLREYVRGERLSLIRMRDGDPASVDSMYAEALRLSWGGAGTALLLCLAATLDHRRVGVNLPVAGPILWFPLTSEFPDEFEARVAALPRRLYADSPEEGDRDKLQHFFGSALVAQLAESRERAMVMGLFVEWGEGRFVVDGTPDPRDARADRQGSAYGMALLDDPLLLPSGYFDPAPIGAHGKEAE
jgi:hypothetical protein